MYKHIKLFLYDKMVRARLINKYYLLKHIVNNGLISAEENVLDFGCGTGCNAFMFSPAKYIGIDNCIDRIEYARRIYSFYSFVLYEKPPLPFQDKIFDKVFVCGVLHHIDDDDCMDIVSEFYRILRDNGKIIILEPCFSANKISNIVMKYFDKGVYIRDQKKYISLFSKNYNVNIIGEFLTPNFYNTLSIVASKI